MVPAAGPADPAAGVPAALCAAGEAFGAPPAAPVTPRWGRLYAELDPDPEPGFVEAIELIYEGYLLHYREPRAVALGADDVEARLLAGDCFYARGLRGIAARADTAAVGLLARLMAACSYLRDEGASFADDDALWAYTTAGLAAGHAGVSTRVVESLFDVVDQGFGDPQSPSPAETVAATVEELGADKAAAVRRELAIAGTGG